MKVLIRGKFEHLPVTSVVVTPDPRDPQGIDLHAMHCVMCGDIIGQYIGQIYMIIPGQIPVQLPYISQCGRCGWRYAIHSIASISATMRS